MDKRVGIIITVIMIGAAAALPFIPDGESLINDYPGIMRFHVIANSDSEEDQALKLKVRDYVLGKVQSGVTRAIADPDTEKSGKSDEAVTREYINDNLSQIEDWARQAIEANGASYEATAETGVRHIPAKQYDDIDLFTSERGWQDWMDNISTQEVIFILNKIYEYSQESLQDIRIKLNYSRVALSRAYYIPLRTLENWDRKQNMPDYVEVLIKYTFFIKEITKNEAITE